MPKPTCDWTKQPLGLVPDEVLAERLGVSIHTVRRQRQRAGILMIDMDIDKKIVNALSGGVALSAAELAERFDKQTTWIHRKLVALVARGAIWRHKCGRGHVYTLAGVKFRHLSPFNGSEQATLKAKDNEGSALDGNACSDPVVDVGTVSFMDYDTEDRSDAFYCVKKRKTITLRHCIDLFGEVHAMHKTHTACWECPQGARHRLEHCYEIEAGADLINDLLRVATKGDRQSEGRLSRAMESKSNGL